MADAFREHLRADEGAEYDQVIEIDLNELQPQARSALTHTTATVIYGVVACTLHVAALPRSVCMHRCSVQSKRLCILYLPWQHALPDCEGAC